MTTTKKNLKNLTLCTALAFTMAAAPAGTAVLPGTAVAEAAAAARLSAKSVSVEVGDTATVTLKNVSKSTKVTVKAAKSGYVSTTKKLEKNKDGSYSCVITLTGKKKGSTKLTVKAAGKTYTCSVKVKAGTVKLSDTKKSIKKGESFTVTLKNAGSKSAKWSVKSKSILKLTRKGRNKYQVTGKKAGTSYVYAKLKGKTYKCKVTVTAPKKTVLSASAVSMPYGTSRSVTLKNAVGKVTWSVSDEEIVKVTASGTNNSKAKLTPVGVGTATVKAVANGKTYKCEVTVKAVSDPELTFSTTSVKAGSTKTIRVMENKYDVQWSSSNEKIATVSKDGVVKGISAGTATITAKADGISLTCTVRVKAAETEPERETTGSTDTSTPKETEKQTGDGETGTTTVVDKKETEKQNETTKQTEKQTESTGKTETEDKKDDGLDGYTFKLASNSRLNDTSSHYLSVIAVTDAPLSDMSYKLIGNENTIIETRYMIETSAEESMSGKHSISYLAFARRPGTVEVVLYYKGTEVIRQTLTVKNTYTDYWNSVAWRKDLESKIWTSNMTAKEKMQAAGQYILDNYDYDTHNSGGEYGFSKGYGGDCVMSTSFLMECAKDLGLEYGYCHYQTETHTAAIVKIDGRWYIVEAGYMGTAGNRNKCTLGSGAVNLEDTICISWTINGVTYRNTQP